MKYNFDTQVNRRNTNSLKWDVAEHELPMWVADMDFKTAPEIIDALQERVSHGIFGYSDITKEWRESIVSWWEKRHSFKMEEDWLIFSTGVVPALSSIVRKLTTPNENVVIQTPVYNIFFNSIVNNGRRVLEAPLVYEGGEYHIDFQDLEEKLADPQTTLMVLCNPHNPIGKIWDHETLEKIGALCKKHHVIVVADEIHCDLTAPGCNYIPFASVSETCKEISITCIAPTKAFNIAGLQTAIVVVPNENLHYKVWRGLNTDEVAEPNAFAIQAAVAAFTKGEPWLEELRAYLQKNKECVLDYVKKEIPKLYVVPSVATYLLWLDCSDYFSSQISMTFQKKGNTQELAEYIREKTGLYLSYGSQFGGNGNQFLRMNIACPKATLLDGLERLKKACHSYELEKQSRKNQ